MRIFGNIDDLSIENGDKIQILIAKIEKAQCTGEISIYYGYPFIELDGQETIMKACIICSKGILAVYSEVEEMTIYRRHLMKLILDSPKLSALFWGNSAILKCVHIDDVEEIVKWITGESDCLNDNDYREVNAIIQNMYGLNHKDERIIDNPDSLGALIKARNNEINTLDQRQFETVYKKTSSHIRIRGLAGSGKTILLVKKMAYMHFKNRELDLAYVFYTKSLKQYIKDLFLNFYRDFEKYKDPDMSKIHILHSWGGMEMEGFYSRACKENGVAAESYNSVSGANKFDKVCWNLLNTLSDNSIKMYDYVFVDEAQDFSLGFFRLVLATLKYSGKMIYAYDELQALNDTYDSMPGKKNIFEKEECEDINLSVCYRTPKNILVAAHALGLGIYRRDKNGEVAIINMMQDYNIWTAVGYKVLAGELGYGCHVTLGREEVIKKRPEKCVEISSVEKERDQYEYVTSEICRLISEEDVLPEDILVIDLQSVSFQTNYSVFKKIFNEKITEIDAIECNVHLVNRDNALKFKRKGSVPYTTIFRAKGNEANIVFILNAQIMSGMQTYSRNRLFTAMTRAKFKVMVLGVTGAAMTTLINEYEEIEKQDFTLTFKYPTEEELKQMRTIAKTEAQKADSYEKAYKNIGDNKDLTIEILKGQTGASSIEELIEFLREYDE